MLKTRHYILHIAAALAITIMLCAAGYPAKGAGNHSHFEITFKGALRDTTDTLAKAVDSLAAADSLAVADSLAASDSLAVADSLALADSLNLFPTVELTPKELKRKIGGLLLCFFFLSEFDVYEVELTESKFLCFDDILHLLDAFGYVFADHQRIC